MHHQVLQVVVFVERCVSVDTIRVYDYLNKNQLCMSRFNSPGSCILWAPKIVRMLCNDS